MEGAPNPLKYTDAMCIDPSHEPRSSSALQSAGPLVDPQAGWAQSSYRRKLKAVEKTKKSILQLR